jgi:uncharacterized membrane protein YcaP (DUF421 family)
MIELIGEFLDEFLGLSVDPSDLHFRHMAARTFIVFAIAVTLARLGARRLLSHNAGFDIMVVVILGSVLSRGINGGASFFPTLGASAVLVALHHVLATLAFHSHGISQLIKGRPRVLVRNGKPDREAMGYSKITDDDLDENLRLHGNIDRLTEVAEARLERNGSVSIIRVKDTSNANAEASRGRDQ